jgi:hypothetical protein
LNKAKKDLQEMNWSGAAGMAFGLMALLTIAILVITAIYYWRVRHRKWDRKCSSSSSSSCRDGSSSSSSFLCPFAATTGPTGCIVLSKLTGCDTFEMRMDENTCGSSSFAPLNCPRGLLTVKKPLPLSELILTATSPTGTFITDIYAQVVPSCGKKPAQISTFAQTGCSVDLAVGYTHFSFTCTGGSDIQSVTLPLPTGVKEHAFLSVVMNVADTCNTPLIVDQLTIEGLTVPHRIKGCPKIPKTLGCAQPEPRYTRIKIPKCCAVQR